MSQESLSSLNALDSLASGVIHCHFCNVLLQNRSALFIEGGDYTRPWEYQETGLIGGWLHRCHQVRNPESQLLLSQCPVEEIQSFSTDSLAPSPSVFWADGPSGTSSLIVYRPQESPAHPLCLWEGLPPWEASIQLSPRTYCTHSTCTLCLDAGV